jgi:hypothetical protein
MPVSLLLSEALQTLSKAEAALATDDTNAGVQFADQSLELALKDACIVAGCSESSTREGKSFQKWNFTDYMQFLTESNLLSRERKASFFQIHNWRNPSHHDGMSIHPKQAKQVVDSVRQYLNESKAAYLDAASASYQETPAEPISEEEDVAPIFRATPSLVGKNLHLVRGEKFLAVGLRRIDLLLEDDSKRNVFVEVKWSGFDPKQAEDYLRLIRNVEADARIIWLMPSDIRASLPPSIERIDYDREKITALVESRRKARRAIHQILYALSAPFTPSPSLMYRMTYAFPNVMSACYFDAKVQTEKGTREIGLRKQSIGRYLDLIKSLCQSKFVSETPELLLILILELLVAPYYLEMRGLGRVAEDGFWGDMKEKEKESSYKDVFKVVEPIYKIANDYVSANASSILQVYASPNQLELIYRVILNLPKKAFEMGDLIRVKSIIESFISEFGITQTEPIKKMRHSVTNTDIVNSVQTGYEADMARRLIEIAVLKRELICTSGVGVIQVLKQEVFREKPQYVRAKCQNFRINTNMDRILGFAEL